MKKHLLKELKQILVEEVRYALYEREFLLDDNGEPAQLPEITKEQAEDMIRNSNGKIFTVTFIKRTDGSLRVMNARLGVKKYLKGGTLPYDAKDYNLIPVFDLQKNEYRIVNLETMQTLKIGGIVYKITEHPNNPVPPKEEEQPEQNNPQKEEPPILQGDINKEDETEQTP
jgi:hypothetical protein